uniref:Uncharacterized protein n=2 Tax=Acrobeloides nanus TaxID=290746 RepID=A0A914CXJ8_9BILA
MDLYENIPRIYGFISYLIFHVISFTLLLILCFADRHSTANENFEREKPVNPALKSSAISRFIYWYVNPFLAKGSKGKFEFGDLWALDKRHTSDYLATRFYQILQNKRPISKKSIIPWIFWPLLRTTWVPLLASFVLTLLMLPLHLVNPLFLTWIIDSVTNHQPFWFSVLIVVLMFITRVLNECLFTKRDLYGLEAYMNAKTVLMNIIFDKMLKISPAARAKTSAGEFVNLITTDVERIRYYWYNLSDFVYETINITICILLLFVFLGHNAMYGLIVIICFVPLNMWCAKLEAKFEDAQMEFKDERLKLMSDVLSGIKVLKLYAWEPSMQQRIAEIREKETSELRKSNFIGMGVMETSYNICPILATIACFVGYTLIEGNQLTPQVAFVSLMLLNMVRNSSNHFPILVSEAIRAFVSMRRISEFLEEDELDEGHIQSSNSNLNDKIVNIENCTFTWDSVKDAMPNQHLHDLTLNIRKGELIGIVGRVGSGKSSLLSSICGEMHKLEGETQVFTSSIGYVPQQPWIQNKTLRDNVLFQKPYDESYYNKTIESCALREDLKILTAADMTEIGERGINLSGGQKARVALARAVYQRADLYVLDDTLSAVDSHVGNHIFENVIGPNGLLKDTTRIFALNSIAFLKQCDRVVVMQDGHINEIGTYDELMSKTDGAFSEWMHEHLKKLVEQQKSKESVIDRDGSEDVHRAEMDDILKELSSSPVNVLIRRFSSIENDRNFSPSYARQVSNRSNISDHQVRQPHLTQNSPALEGQLIDEEFMEIGNVSWRMYVEYIRAFGFRKTLLYVSLLFFVSGALETLANIWLAKWTSDLEQDAKNPKNLIIYGTSSIINCVSLGTAGFIFAWGAFVASTKFHNSLVHSLLRSPMSFFDTTPLGRILNRLSNDIERIDEELSGTFAYVCFLLALVFQSVITIIIVIPELLIIAIPPIIVFIKLVRYYTATSVQIRRLVSKSWSLVTSYVQDAYVGADSLRVFNVVSRSKEQMRQMSDMTIETDHTEITCNRWVQVRLDLLTQVAVFGFIMIAIYLGDIRVISMGILALVITNGESFSGYWGEIARQWKDAEMNIVCVERINEYVNNKHEASWQIESRKPPYNWPTSGIITFKDLCLKYREDTDLVLKHLNFNVNGGEKIGIVGRTGAGKTSLTLALFRLIEPASGTIEIDGVDICQIGLHDLRRALTIIPQDPVLFCGTLRSNLDPFDEFTDDEVWLAIEQAHLKQFVVNFEEKLEYEINEGGSNLSVGQRQLVCLARALLRKNTKILVLDEATAAIDVETDRLIQESIREYFGHCTILTIAHRLNTILDYDKILAMDKGEVKELDTPRNLLSDPNSLFYSLAKSAGISLDSL